LLFDSEHMEKLTFAICIDIVENILDKKKHFQIAMLGIKLNSNVFHFFVVVNLRLFVNVLAGFVSRVIRRAPLVEQELFTLPES